MHMLSDSMISLIIGQESARRTESRGRRRGENSPASRLLNFHIRHIKQQLNFKSASAKFQEEMIGSKIEGNMIKLLGKTGPRGNTITEIEEQEQVVATSERQVV